MVEFEGRVALVSGASRGIGKAIALALGRAGAAVAVNYRERSEEAVAVTEAIRSAGGRAAAFGADVSLGTAVHNRASRTAPQRPGSKVLRAPTPCDSRPRA
jgi:3-oxoacyl-[acyl-carrier protein] reductase